MKKNVVFLMFLLLSVTIFSQNQTNGFSSGGTSNSYLHWCKVSSPTDTGTSVDDILTTENIKVFPNPCTNFINVSVDNGELIKIYDSTGKLVKISYSNKINVNDLKSGLYILKYKNKVTKLEKN